MSFECANLLITLGIDLLPLDLCLNLLVVLIIKLKSVTTIYSQETEQMQKKCLIMLGLCLIQNTL